VQAVTSPDQLELLLYQSLIELLRRGGAPAGQPGWPLDEVTDPFVLEVHRPVEPDVPQPGLPVLPAYVPRAHDVALAEVVAAAGGTSGIAVLVGGSSTGKTRACWQALELLRGLEPGWRLWHPIDSQAALAGLSGVGPRTVVWLNEAQRYLDTADGAGEQVAAGLRELLRERDRGPVLVLATLWPDSWSELTVRPPEDQGQDPHAQARELLTGHNLPVPAKFDDDQLRELHEAADPRLAQAAAGSRDGEVIQYLAGVPDLLERYRIATPAARALINAAMDAARLGMRPALSRAFLEAAAPGYLTDTEWERLPGGWLEQALDYTGALCKGVRGPLTPVRPRPAPGALASAGGGSAWQLADYLDQHGRRVRGEAIPPEGFWAAAASYAHADDLITLAEAARARGLYRDAARLYKQASGHGDPMAGARLVRLLHTLHPGDQRPAEWATTNVRLDGREGVAQLLGALRDAGATGQVTALLDRDPAAHASLDDAVGVAQLLGALHDAGATGQVTALLDRDPAAHASLDNLWSVAELLSALYLAGATGQVAALATRAAAHVSLDDPRGVARLLGMLPAGQDIALLDRGPAAHVSLDDPGGVAWLLDALRYAQATGQVTALLDRDPAAHARLDDPLGVAHLLPALREAGATGQVTTLLDRDPAAHSRLDNSGSVARLMGALREAGAPALAAKLIERLPAAGQFDLFRDQEGREEGWQAKYADLNKRRRNAGQHPLFYQPGPEHQYWFGREADGRPAKRWTWTDLG
jgi:hypothetical protein